MELRIEIPERQRTWLRSLPIEQQYAHFCAMGDERQYYKRRYARGLDDFARLVLIEGVEQIGIDWQNVVLFVGTACIDAWIQEDIPHELGHYIISIAQNPSRYTISNVTRTINDFAHPHAMQGGPFCMADGNTFVMTAIADGILSDAISILMTALRMRPGTVQIGSPYPSAALEHWPLKQQGGPE